ncbi:MAG TPA: response regulator [Deltaproteobacteria bacterium]|jgi:DNA-binding NtrC family response regulator|nr:response regulator [Deltaproteobacteria bacterium]HQJ07822.1 response regulator [Deltaproteobacteria bacterium]
MEHMHAAVIDDDAGILDLIEQILREEGIDTKRYHQGEDFLPHLDKYDFDIIISDLVLPGISGLDLLDELKARGKDIPVVIITGYASLDSAINAVNRGAFYYIKKPFNIEEIRFVIHRLRQRQDTMKEMEALKNQVKLLQAELGKEKGEDVQNFVPLSPLSLLQGNNDVAKALSAIEYLGRLKSGGIISEKEFGEYKGKILKRIV